MAVSVRFLCHLPNEEMAIHFSSTISCLIVERISQAGCLCEAEKRMILRIENVKAVEVCDVTKEVASTGASLSCMSQHLVPFSAAQVPSTTDGSPSTIFP